jgi:hypothetical protein
MSGYGRAYEQRVLQSAPEELRSHPMFTFQMAERDFVTRRSKNASQAVLAKMSGIYAAYKPGHDLLTAGRLGEELGMTPGGTRVVIDLMREFERSRGFNINRFSPNAEREFRLFMREKQKDPAYHEKLSQMGQFKPIMDAALEQGRGSKTAMDNIADSMDSIRGALTNYWVQWKAATAEVFGLDKTSAGAAALAAASVAMVPGVAAAGVGRSVMDAFQEQRGFRAAAAPTASTDTTILHKNTARDMAYELATRDANVQPR